MPQLATTKLNWRRIFVAVPFSESDFNFDAFRESLGVETLPNEWILLEPDSDGEDLHGHARFTPEDELGDPSSVKGDEEQFRPDYVLDIRTYREPLESPRRPELEGIDTAAYQQFLSGLANGFQRSEGPSQDVLFMTHVVLEFAATESRWRVPFLEEKPELGELEPELGRVTLSGAKFRFEESPVGLYYSSVDTSPDDSTYVVHLGFRSEFAPKEIPSVYSEIVEQASQFASLFVVDAGSAEEVIKS